MLLSDIFSIPFLICLAICILLIGCSSIYFYQRIMQQDHKIASMVSLISSMAEEPATCSSMPCSAPSTISFANKPTTSTSSFNTIQQLIAVSDDDESDDESESSCSSTGEEDYDDNSDYSETSSENDGEEHILSAVDFDDLNVDLENSEAVDELSHEANTEMAPQSLEEEVHDTTKSIHLDAEVTDFSIFKSINISDESPQQEETSYKKMSLTKLREIAQLNGHSDVSKLKKPELLKLLEAE
jgi:hypothetical protein